MEWRHLETERRLEHEGLGAIGHAHRGQLLRAGLGKACRVGAVGRHHAVQAGTARQEPLHGRQHDQNTI